MIQVEQRPLGAFEEDVFAAPERVLDQRRRVVEVVAQAPSPARGKLDEGIGAVRLGAVPGEEEVLVREDAVQPGPQGIRIEQVLHPQACPGRAVLVGGTDPATRRANLAVAEGRLAGRVQCAVIRQDHVRGAAHPHVSGVDSPFVKHFELADQGVRVHDDPAADNGRDVGVEHPRGDQVELERLLADDDRVAGVIAAVGADHDRDRLGEEVGRLALALVAPLKSHDDGGRHHRPSGNEETPVASTGARWAFWVDSPIVSPESRRGGWPKVLVRLTGRT